RSTPTSVSCAPASTRWSSRTTSSTRPISRRWKTTGRGRRSSSLIEIEQFTVTQARKSTLLVAGVLALISGWQLYRHRPTASLVLAIIVGVLLVCAAIPALAVIFHKWWMTLAGVLGYVNSRIILSVMFFLL